MHPESITRRYAILRAEIRLHMSVCEKWRGLPALLDELHTLRKQYAASRRSQELLSEESEKLAFRDALH